MKSIGREAFSCEQDLETLELLKGIKNFLFNFLIQNF
jgi:hypothetical protein